MGFLQLRKFTRATLPLLLCLATIQLAQAEIKLAKVEGWSASALNNQDNALTIHEAVHVRPADHKSPALVVSSNISEIQISYPDIPDSSISITFDTTEQRVWETAVGDFDSDSSIEVAALIWDMTWPEPHDPACDHDCTRMTRLYLICWDISDTNISDTVIYEIEAEWDYWRLHFNMFPSMLTSLSSSTGTHDRLAVSISWIRSGISYGFWWGMKTEGLTEVWDYFPSEKLDSIPSPLLVLEFLEDGRRMITGYSETFNEISGPDHHYFSSMTTLQDSDSTDWRLPIEPFEGIGCDPEYDWVNIIIQEPLVFGDLSQSTSGIEILSRQTHRSACENIAQYEAFTFQDGGVVTSLWKLNSLPFERFVYHQSRPGHFMGTNNQTLYEFNGATGEKIDSSIDILPNNIIGWYDIYGDGNQYLLTQNDTLLEAYTFDFITDVTEEPDPTLPSAWSLSQPYPNPFNPTVNFALTVPKKSTVTVSVYNILGQKVSELQNGTLSAGTHKLQWNANNHPSGLYLIRAANSAESWSATQKAMLLK